MMMKKLTQWCLAAATLLTLTIGTAAADLLVIVHPDNPNKIDAKFVKNLYLGKESRFENGDIAEPVMLGEKDSLTKLFMKEVLRQKPVQFKRLWSKLLFTGEGTPPAEFDSQEALIQAVMSNPKLVGYIDADNYTNDVRAVLRLRTN